MKGCPDAGADAERPLIEIEVIPESAMEALFAFKCSAPDDMSLEIRIRNAGPEPIVILSRCDLERDGETRTIPNLYPPGGRRIGPGEKAAFYSSLDEETLTQYSRITFLDSEGRRYTAPLGVPTLPERVPVTI